MSKKTFVIIAVLAILAVGGVTGYFVLGSRSKGTTEEGQTSKEEVKADTLFEDSAGFSFKHPKDVKVTDVTPDEDDYYTELNLARGSEMIVLTAKDTSAKTVDDWLKTDSIYSGANLVGATTLGGISAKQYAKGEKLITAAVDQGVLYLIEGPKDGSFWEEVQGALVSSFTFAGGASASSGSGGASDIIYEEEKVIE